MLLPSSISKTKYREMTETVKEGDMNFLPRGGGFVVVIATDVIIGFITSASITGVCIERMK
jgi:hypothetical protein